MKWNVKKKETWKYAHAPTALAPTKVHAVTV